MTLETTPVRWKALAMQALPIVAGVLLITMRQVQRAGADDWGTFAMTFVMEMATALPLLLAHLAATRLPRGIAAILWVAVFALAPFILPLLLPAKDGIFFTHWVLLGVLSAVSLLFGRREDGGFLDILQRLPITLDGTIAALLGAWVLAVSLLFISTPDPVNNQPLSVWFDGARIVGNPGLFLGYLLQFGFVASLLFFYYWVCRHWLVRRVLRKRGWIMFGLASLVFWVLATPILASLVIPIPLNEPHWTILPSETPNPFAPTNYGFSFVLWAIACPIVLASERLLQERGEAMSRHERVRAELTQLQQQINPHFLFNTLNTLYALCLRDNRASAEAVVKLSDLLRYSVYEGQEEWIGLDREIEQLKNYLALQELRFGKRCTVTTDWPQDAAAYCIPPQMLIMLVENAFKHGVEPSDQPSKLDIALVIDGQRMRFTCANQPIAVAKDGKNDGVGLANLRRRLELMFGDDFTLESGRQGDAWHAELQLELRPC